MAIALAPSAPPAAPPRGSQHRRHPRLPAGAARFASWLLGELARHPGGFTPAPADAWANSGWSGDAHFKGCG